MFTRSPAAAAAKAASCGATDTTRAGGHGPEPGPSTTGPAGSDRLPRPPGAGSVRFAAFPDPSIIKAPPGTSAPAPPCRTGEDPDASHGRTSYPNRRTGVPDPDS